MQPRFRRLAVVVISRCFRRCQLPPQPVAHAGFQVRVVSAGRKLVKDRSSVGSAGAGSAPGFQDLFACLYATRSSTAVQCQPGIAARQRATQCCRWHATHIPPSTLRQQLRCLIAIGALRRCNRLQPVFHVLRQLVPMIVGWRSGASQPVLGFDLLPALPNSPAAYRRSRVAASLMGENSCSITRQIPCRRYRRLAIA